MSVLTHRRAGGPTDRAAIRALTVCVVDPSPDDVPLSCVPGGPTNDNGLKRINVGTAAEALRLARAGGIDRWVINTHLPDMSGCELCELVRSYAPQTPVYLVAETYSAELERAAYLARASLFTVKPSPVHRPQPSEL